MGWQYDRGGRLTAATDARQNTTTTCYDPANRVTDVNQPTIGASTPASTSGTPNTHTTYDFDGNVRTVRDPNGHTTTNCYDALNRLISSKDALDITVTNSYDQVGNKLSVEDGNNNTTKFTYDGLNRLLTTTDAAGQSTTLSYDALNKTGRADALGQATSYGYDVRNRLQCVAYTPSSAANSKRKYVYDNVGNLLSVTELSETAANVAYIYDALNRVATETSGGETHTYTLDLAGNRLQTVYGGTGRTITSLYDALNRLSSMQDQTATEITASNPGRSTTYGYDLNGNIVTKVLPNGDTESALAVADGQTSEGFDPLNRQTYLNGTTHSGSLLYNYQYGYDLAGNVLTVAESYPLRPPQQPHNDEHLRRH